MKKECFSIVLAAVCAAAFASGEGRQKFGKIADQTQIVTNGYTKSETDSVSSNIANALIRSYDQTNLTGRINAKIPWSAGAVTTNAANDLIAAGIAGKRGLTDLAIYTNATVFTRLSTGPQGFDNDSYDFDDQPYLNTLYNTWEWGASNRTTGARQILYGMIIKGDTFEFDRNAYELHFTAKKSLVAVTNGNALATISDVTNKADRSELAAKYAQADGTQLAAQVAAIGAHLNAEDARFVSTNYNSATRMPEASVEIKLPDGSWSVIWREMTRWNYLFDEYLPTNYYVKASVDAALSEKADRAWGYCDSHTGGWAPDGYTWISSPRIAIAGGMAYQRTLTSEGAVWVLESNGLVAETCGTTNGYFRITDDEGQTQFEIVKGDRRMLGADAASCQIVAGFSPTKLQIGYSVVADAHPTIYVCDSLTNANWKAETDAECLANVTWSGTSGAYVAQVQGKTAQASLFVKATYETGGETYIRNAAPVSMEFIYLGGTKYRLGTAAVGGNTVLTLTEVP